MSKWEIQCDRWKKISNNLGDTLLWEYVEIS